VPPTSADRRRGGTFREPERLRQIERLQREFLKLPGVSATVSMVDRSRS
jgi:hypothetical protein